MYGVSQEEGRDIVQCLCQPVVCRTEKAVIGKFGEQAFVEQDLPCAKIGEHASIRRIDLDRAMRHPRQQLAPTSRVILPTWSKPGGIAESIIPASAATVHDLECFCGAAIQIQVTPGPVEAGSFGSLRFGLKGRQV